LQTVVWLAATGLCLSPGLVSAYATEDRIQLNSELAVLVRDGRDLFLEVRPGTPTTYEGLAERFAGSRDMAAEISAGNDHEPPDRAERLLLPFNLLHEDFRSLVLLNLFPDDRLTQEGWFHKAQAGAVPTAGEGMWQVAAWFTGDGDRFDELMEQNGMTSPELRPGQTIRIPRTALIRALRREAVSDDGSLQYGRDREGPYAGYRLKAGEAMYSSVVVRFTGRTRAENVVQLAGELATRSGISDMGDIPVGYLIKIPFAELTPEYLPVTHPRRKEAEADQVARAEALAEAPVPVTQGGLEGVLVIIDPGHGGRDTGTIKYGLTEHEYVYDVACRLRRILAERTAARVEMTLKDRKTGYKPSRGDRIKSNRQGEILTHPPFLAKAEGDARIGVNLRWYLANSLYRNALKSGTDKNKVVFLSLHADSRHPSLRGAMIYVPGARYRTRTYGVSGAAYAPYREVKEKPTTRFGKNQRVRSEAVSRELANQILKGFRRQGLEIPKTKPVRDSIIRSKGRRWLPAVLRGNEVPTKVLVEMLNLSNKQDAEVLGKARNREKLAAALADGILTHFGEKPLQ
jgi:N-acetylmuramoyl-L-alanine amidase